MAKFTPSEWEIIDHRLGAIDAIVEVFLDADEPIATDAELTDAVCELVKDGAKRDVFTPLEIEILKDCCEGSTYFADIDDAVATGEITQGKRLAMFKAANSLGDKLNTFVTTS